MDGNGDVKEPFYLATIEGSGSIIKAEKSYTDTATSLLTTRYLTITVLHGTTMGTITLSFGTDLSNKVGLVKSTESTAKSTLTIMIN